MLSIEQAIGVVRDAMRSEQPQPFGPMYDVVEARLVEFEGRMSWAVIVAVPGDPGDWPFSVAGVDPDTGVVEWMPGIS